MGNQTIGKARVKYVHCALTGRVITSRTVALTNPFCGQWIFNAVADSLECDVDDLTTLETDEGEFIELNGERVAYVSVG